MTHVAYHNETAGHVATGEPASSTLRRMAAEVRNRLIIDNIRDAVIVTDANGVVTDWNEGAVQLFGWSAAEMIGRPYASRYPQPQRQFIVQEMARRLDGSDWDGEYEDLRKDGTPVWIEARVRRIVDGEGRAIGIVGLSHDITDRRRAEAALREKDELNRAVLDSMAAHVAVLGPDGHIRAVNRAWRDFTLATLPPGTPYPPSCDVGASYLAACSADDEGPSGAAAATRQGILEVLSGARARFEIEYPCHGPGRKQWFHLSVTPLEGGQGGCVVAHMDITERREAEDALRQAQAVAHVGDWAVDLGTGTLTGSDEAYRILGLGPGPHSSADVRKLVHPSDRARFREAWEACLAGAPLVTEHRLIVDGQVRWVETRGHREAGPHGKLSRVVGVIQDITSRWQLEERLRQAQKMEAVGQLAGGVAHDFNNLLTVITGFTGMMLDAAGPEDPLHEQLTEIQSAGEQAAALTARLLAFSRRTVIEPKVLDLNDLTESTLKLLRRVIGEDITPLRQDSCHPV